jgi:hypothetical protein
MKDYREVYVYDDDDDDDVDDDLYYISISF